jgi:hypothetical protein
MTHLKSSNSKPDRGVVSAMQRTLLFGISGATVLTTTLAVVFAIALDGCSSKPKNTNSNSTSQSSSKQSVQTTEVSPLPGLPIGKSTAVQAKTGVTKKDPAVQRPSTVTYTDSRYGVSFRYPRKYTLMTAGKRLEANAERHLKDAAEMALLFRDHPQAIAESGAVLERADALGTTASSATPY